MYDDFSMCIQLCNRDVTFTDAGEFRNRKKNIMAKSKRNQIYNIIAGKDKDNYFNLFQRRLSYIFIYKKKFKATSTIIKTKCFL